MDKIGLFRLTDNLHAEHKKLFPIGAINGLREYAESCFNRVKYDIISNTVAVIIGSRIWPVTSFITKL